MSECHYDFSMWMNAASILSAWNSSSTVMILIVRSRFIKFFDEVHHSEGERVHSAEELFVTEHQLKCMLCISGHNVHCAWSWTILKPQYHAKWNTLPLHKLPLAELRKYHLGRKHLPRLIKFEKLSSTVVKFRETQEAAFRNTFLLRPPGAMS